MPFDTPALRIIQAIATRTGDLFQPFTRNDTLDTPEAIVPAVVRFTPARLEAMRGALVVELASIQVRREFNTPPLDVEIESAAVIRTASLDSERKAMMQVAAFLRDQTAMLIEEIQVGRYLQPDELWQALEKRLHHRAIDRVKEAGISSDGLPPSDVLTLQRLVVACKPEQWRTPGDTSFKSYAVWLTDRIDEAFVECHTAVGRLAVESRGARSIVHAVERRSKLLARAAELESSIADIDQVLPPLKFHWRYALHDAVANVSVGEWPELRSLSRYSPKMSGPQLNSLADAVAGVAMDELNLPQSIVHAITPSGPELEF